MDIHQLFAALGATACATLAFAAPDGYVEVFETNDGMIASVHPDVRDMALSTSAGRAPIKLTLADVWLEQRTTHTAQRNGYRCDSPGSSFPVLMAHDGRLFRLDVPISSPRGALGFALWDYVCTKARSPLSTPVGNAAKGIAAPKVAAPSGPKQGPGAWTYGVVDVPGTGEKVKLARNPSVGYEGTLMVRLGMDGAGTLGSHVIVRVPNSIVCPEPCKVRVIVDGESELRDARPPAGIDNMLYFSAHTLPTALVAKSHAISMEINLGKEGWRVLTFNTSGFDWSGFN